MSETPNINIQLDSGVGRVLNILGTLLLCGAVGAVAYALAEYGWVEIAATGLTTFLFQLGRMMTANGLLSFESKRLGKDDFKETRGLVSTMYKEYLEFQAKSPLWRLASLAFAYTVGFLIARQLVSVGLTIFSNLYIAGAAAALLAAVIIAPGQITDLLSKMRSGPNPGWWTRGFDSGYESESTRTPGLIGLR